MPSNNTDFPNNNPNTIQLHVTSAKKNIIGDYHVTGEIVNAGNDTIQSVMVTVHMYEGSNRLIGESTCCYTMPTNIDPGHSSSFDSSATADQMNELQPVLDSSFILLTTPLFQLVLQ